MKDKITEQDINEHLETYSPLFNKINNDEPYKPSLLFGWQEKIAKFVSKYIQTDCLDGEEELKEFMKIFWWGVSVFVVITLGFVILT
jgi:hypothetical protein